MTRELLSSENEYNLNIEPPRVYDWALEDNGEIRILSTGRIMLASSVIGVGATLSCRFGMDVPPALAVGVGTVSLFGGVLAVAYTSLREGT